MVTTSADKVTPCCHSEIVKFPHGYCCNACGCIVDPVDCIVNMPDPMGWAAVELDRINSEIDELVECMIQEGSK